MDSRTDPPQRPRRHSADVVLIVAAMVVLAAYLGLYANHELDVSRGLKDLVRQNEGAVVVGFPAFAIVLLAAALVLRPRRPRS